MFEKGLLLAAILITPLTAMSADGTSDGAAHAPAAWASMDSNSDGMLTKNEVASTPWADRFDRIDANHDGKATKKEYAAYMKAMKKSQRKRDDANN